MKENKYNITFGTGGLGTLIAAIISYINWHHIGWMILHGLLGWIYVIYYLIKYGALK